MRYEVKQTENIEDNTTESMNQPLRFNRCEYFAIFVSEASLSFKNI